MCTVSYVPTNQGFILTSNRDEIPKKNSCQKPSYSTYNNVKVLHPKDKLTSGTWIATDGKKFSLCLFNGAYKNHVHTPPYRESRGSIIPTFFKYSEIISFITRYEFTGIEPFSLVIIKHQPLKLWLFIWDGENTNLNKLPAEIHHLWSSVTLYSKEIHKKKKNAFHESLNKLKQINQKNIVAVSYTHLTLPTILRV